MCGALTSSSAPEDISISVSVDERSLSSWWIIWVNPIHCANVCLEAYVLLSSDPHRWSDTSGGISWRKEGDRRVEKSKMKVSTAVLREPARKRRNKQGQPETTRQLSVKSVFIVVLSLLFMNDCMACINVTWLTPFHAVHLPPYHVSSFLLILMFVASAAVFSAFSSTL